MRSLFSEIEQSEKSTKYFLLAFAQDGNLPVVMNSSNLYYVKRRIYDLVGFRNE